MTSKIITYDLCAPGRNYDNLYETIKAYRIWAHIAESIWFVKTTDSCSQVRDNLISYIDSNDRLFVGELTGNAAWNKVICDNNYLKNNL